MPFNDEQISSGFGVPGQEIKQTVSKSFDVFSGIDVDASTFQNTNYGIKISNQDGRVPLGLFYFDDDNLLRNDFPPIVSDTKFRQIEKPNLVANGDCKYIDGINTKDWMRRFNGQPQIVLPGGNQDFESWGYCAYDGVGIREKSDSWYTGDGEYPEDENNSFPQSGQELIDSFEQSDNFNSDSDNQGATAYAGWLAYLSLLQKNYKYVKRAEKAWSGQPYVSSKASFWAQWFQFMFCKTTDDFPTYNVALSNQLDDNSPEGDIRAFYPISKPFTALSAKVQPYNSEFGTQYVTFPNIAKWIQTDDAYSHNRCLDFTAVDFTNGTTAFCDDEFYPYINLDGTQYEPETYFERVFVDDAAFSWADGYEITDNQNIGYTELNNPRPYNQYRTLNQVCTIYRGATLPDEERINPFTIMEVKFKMRTMEEGFQSDNPPQIELAVVDGDYFVGDPRRWQNSVSNMGFNLNHHYWPHGDFNTLRYDASQNSPNSLDKKYSNFGSMGRFQNTKLNEWETFSYRFCLGDYFRYSNGNVRRLSLIVQAAGNFVGRVLMDDFEVYESGDFVPDVDVRKKISAGNYGSADLTQYYDEELQPEEYKDTQAPLEAQFYFYPQYPSSQVFDQTRTPIYEDFKKGCFYLYDVDWGDGSANDFVSDPEKIDEETAVYHTYTTNGIFEVKGTMLRMKLSEDDEILGIIHSKKFRLKINVNEGSAEDFKYFGSDGFSFLPYKNILPIVGGYSKQSMYYKSINRQVGFITDNIKTNVQFNNDGDRLKTELALLKMDSSRENELDIVPAYLEERYDESQNLVTTGIKPIKDELGKSIGDCNLTCIKYYNEPKSIWEMFGFEQEDLNQVGNPNESRYWKNIIPQDYSIFNREGIMLSQDGVSAEYIDTFNSEQDFVDDFYYPVLPKYKLNGEFIEPEIDENGNIESGTYPNNKIPFPVEAPITNENETNTNLLLNITSEDIETNVLRDYSGNDNLGFVIGDYKPKFDDKTLQPKVVKTYAKLASSKLNGAF